MSLFYLTKCKKLLKWLGTPVSELQVFLKCGLVSHLTSFPFKMINNNYECIVCRDNSHWWAIILYSYETSNQLIQALFFIWQFCFLNQLLENKLSTWCFFSDCARKNLSGEFTSASLLYLGIFDLDHIFTINIKSTEICHYLIWS